jgi:hypothetical protein
MFYNHRQIHQKEVGHQQATKTGGSMDAQVVYGGNFMNCYLKWVVKNYKTFDECNNNDFRSLQ